MINFASNFLTGDNVYQVKVKLLKLVPKYFFEDMLKNDLYA